MTDIVVRLRCDAGEFFMRYGDTLLTEAADELEKLHDLLGKANALARIRWGEIERLRQAIKYEDNRFGHIGTHGPDCYTWGPKHYECALAEIERLKAELEAETQRRWDGNRMASAEATADFNEMRDMAVKEMARWAREAGASQAREAKLRAFCEFVYRDVSLNDYGSEKLDEVLALPTDDSALKEAIKQGQREVLLKAANKLNYGDIAYTELRKMAEEIVSP